MEYIYKKHNLSGAPYKCIPQKSRVMTHLKNQMLLHSKSVSVYPNHTYFGKICFRCPDVHNAYRIQIPYKLTLYI